MFAGGLALLLLMGCDGIWYLSVCGLATVFFVLSLVSFSPISLVFMSLCRH
ncbi:unnamed protein product [Arabidopsis lyrata]|nr:unnamed protein product [Arabidopsis lyrata]